MSNLSNTQSAYKVPQTKVGKTKEIDGKRLGWARPLWARNKPTLIIRTNKLKSKRVEGKSNNNEKGIN